MYKYNLLERMDKLNGNDREIFWKWAPEQLFRNKETIRGWFYIKANDPREIGVLHLLKLSIFFGCSVEALFTEQPDTKAIVESIKTHSHVCNGNTSCR